MEVGATLTLILIGKCVWPLACTKTLVPNSKSLALLTIILASRIVLLFPTTCFDDITHLNYPVALLLVPIATQFHQAKQNWASSSCPPACSLDSSGRKPRWDSHTWAAGGSNQIPCLVYLGMLHFTHITVKVECVSCIKLNVGQKGIVSSPSL